MSRRRSRSCSGGSGVGSGGGGSVRLVVVVVVVVGVDQVHRGQAPGVVVETYDERSDEARLFYYTILYYTLFYTILRKSNYYYSLNKL